MPYDSRNLATHLSSFNKRLIVFLDGLHPTEYKKILPWEGYPILTVAGHIGGPRHYGMTNFIKKMIAGQPLPKITSDIVIHIANQDFKEHENWSKKRVLAYLVANVREAENFIATLSDEQLSRTGKLDVLGGEITVKQLIEWIIIDASVEHLENMKRVVL